MSEHGFDREIHLRAIGWFVFGLVVVIAASFATIGLLSGWFQDQAHQADPPGSPIPDAAIRRVPPLPRLQTTPEAELQTMRREEDAILASYAWVDRERGLARVPIERAMELLLEQGLPARHDVPRKD